MLQIIVPKSEKWDEKNEVFINTKEQVLTLEHSLVSLSKWESKHCKPFLTKEDKSSEEMLDYIKCMTLTQCVNQEVYKNLTNDNLEEVYKYIEAPMTATWITDEGNGKGGGNKRIITSELIYYWMISLGIPFECQKWHLNRLITLIRVCEEENKPKNKQRGKSFFDRRRKLNSYRRKKYNTRG